MEANKTFLQLYMEAIDAFNRRMEHCLDKHAYQQLGHSRLHGRNARECLAYKNRMGETRELLQFQQRADRILLNNEGVKEDEANIIRRRLSINRKKLSKWN